MEKITKNLLIITALLILLYLILFIYFVVATNNEIHLFSPKNSSDNS